MALLNDLMEAFNNSSPDAPPPGGMTFEQRAMLISALYGLKDRDGRGLREWLFELRRVLGYAEATRPLVEAIDVDRATNSPSEPNTEIEKNASDIARIGIRLAETHPVAAFGGDVRHLIAESVEAALARSRPVRLLRLLLPTLLILFSGGLLWGTFQVQGVKDAASQARMDIQTMQVAVSEAAAKANKDVSDTAAKANSDIAQLNTNLVVGWKNQLQAEAQSQLKELASSVQKAEADAAISIRAELDKITDWGKSKKGEIEAAAEAEKDAINGLVPMIETAKAQAAPKVQGVVNDITEWSRNQQAVVGKELDLQKAAIIQEMANRSGDVQAEQTRVKTRLALVLNDVRNGNDEVQKQLVATQEGEQKLRIRLEALQKLLDQSMRLQTIIERADAKSTLTFATLVNALEWKDGIAIAAGVASLLAMFFSLIALRRA
jgi:hypothetical protein